ncbi:phospholipase D-like domain-containing protein [Vibrio parahaemolyticus]
MYVTNASIKVLYFIIIFVFISLSGCSVPTYDVNLSQKVGGDEKEFKFIPLSDNIEALNARIKIIDEAINTIDIKYYIYKDGDETTKILSGAIYNAANRGVRVRLLLDGLGSRAIKCITAISQHKNIKVRLFNPIAFELKTMMYINYRMHNKMIVADGNVAIIGGRNVGDEYLTNQYGGELFQDFDVFVRGDIVNDVSLSFNQYWTFDYSEPLSEHQTMCDGSIHLLKELNHKYHAYISKAYSHSWGKKIYNSKGEYWADHPDKKYSFKNEVMQNVYYKMASAQESIIIVSPYFIPCEFGMQLLKSVREKGVEVTIITNSLSSNDVFLVHGWYKKYRSRLINMGVDLWEIKRNQSRNNVVRANKSSLHAKVVIIDEKELIVGSMNIDPRSMFFNTENALLIRNEIYLSRHLVSLPNRLREAAYKLSIRDGNTVWTDMSTNYDYYEEPESKSMVKFWSHMSRILPIEVYL